MRLKSELWVKAYIRRCMAAGVPAVVVRRGDADAGTILIRIARLNGHADLYGPAPAGYVGDSGDRNWVPLLDNAIEADVEARIAREVHLDSDAWVVEAEDRAGRHFLDGWLASA